MWPQLTLLTLVALFAAYALLSGITAIVGAIRNRKKNDDWWVMLLLGIVSTGAGAGHGRQCPGNWRARYIVAGSARSFCLPLKPARRQRYG
jgi:H+/Cl- antiporter ClcA